MSHLRDTQETAVIAGQIHGKSTELSIVFSSHQYIET